MVVAETNPDPSVPSTTTAEEDRHSASQRGFDVTWENTQARISMMVVGTTCLGVLTNVIVRMKWPDRVIAIPAEWWTIVGLVIGFYFGRTNHSRPPK